MNLGGASILVTIQENVGLHISFLQSFINGSPVNSLAAKFPCRQMILVDSLVPHVFVYDCDINNKADFKIIIYCF